MQKVPRDRGLELKSRLSISIQIDIDCSGGMFPVCLHMIDVQPTFFQLAQRFESARVFADTTGDNPLIAHQGGDVAIAGAVDASTATDLVVVEAQHWVIEHVECIHTELHLDAFCDREVLHHGSISEERTRPTE